MGCPPAFDGHACCVDGSGSAEALTAWAGATKGAVVHRSGAVRWAVVVWRGDAASPPGCVAGTRRRTPYAAASATPATWETVLLA